MYIADGELVLVVEGEDYVLGKGECVTWPSSHPHTMRNDSDAPAVAVGFTTEYGLLMTEMRLYDIRVTVERIEGRSVCGLEVGDYFEVTESNRVRIPAGQPLLPVRAAVGAAADPGEAAAAARRRTGSSRTTSSPAPTRTSAW